MSKKFQVYALSVSLMGSLATACSVVGPDSGQGAGQSVVTGSIKFDDQDHDQIANNFVHAMAQINKLSPIPTTIQMVKSTTPFGGAVEHHIIEKGYGHQLVKGDRGRYFLRYRVEEVETQAGYIQIFRVDIGKIALEREFQRIGSHLTPVSAMRIVGAGKSEVQLNDDIFRFNNPNEFKSQIENIDKDDLVEAKIIDKARLPLFIVDKPAEDKPTVAKPTAAKSIAAKPIAAKPIAAKPIAAKSIAAKPTAAKPIAAKLIAAKPIAAKPTAAKPIAAKPIAAKPIAAKPIAAKPTAVRPIMVRPLVDRPILDKPTVVTPTELTPAVATTPTAVKVISSNGNVVEKKSSNYQALFVQYQDIDQTMLPFVSDSVKLSFVNWGKMEVLLKEYNVDTDVFSVVGCGPGKTLLDQTNTGLAVSRADRVKAALIRGNVGSEKIYAESCWGDSQQDEELPQRTVMLTLKRKVE